MRVVRLRAVYRKLARIFARSGPLPCALVAVFLLSVTAIAIGRTPFAYDARVWNLAASIALFMGAAVFAIAWLRQRAVARELARKLQVAETQYAAVLNFNSAEFKDKSRLLELTLNHMNQGVAVIRPDGRFWLYNKQALEYTGAREEDLPFPPTAADVFAFQIEHGEFGKDGELLPPEARAFIMERKGKPPRSYIRQRPNGMVLEIRSDPMPDGSLIQTYTDITELANAKKAAEVAARAKAQFLATMSHEIRTPLNGVLGAANLLHDTPLNRQQAEFVELIAACGQALLVVINDILDFSKFESTGVHFDPAPASLADIFRSALAVTQTAAAAKGLPLRPEGLDALPPAVLIDGARLRQVLINLLGNAVKFTAEGSVTLRAQTNRNHAGLNLRVSVIDTGIGVARDKRERLFQEFAQEDTTISRRFGGTGLGLAICKKIVEAMGGQIGVEGAEGAGSTFWFSIPLTETDLPVEGKPLQAAKSTASRACRILVAEDIRTNRMVIEATLRALGHDVELVENGVEALAALRERRFDVVLLDMQMPEMDGLEAARRIRQMGGAFAQLPIIALTANAFTSDRDACMAAGMNGFVTKPFDPAQVQGEIARLVGDAPAVEGLVATAQEDASANRPPADEARAQEAPAMLVAPQPAGGQLERLAAHMPADALVRALAAIASEADRLHERLADPDEVVDRPAALALLRSTQMALFDLGVVEAGDECDFFAVILESGVTPDAQALDGWRARLAQSLARIGRLPGRAPTEQLTAK